MENTLPTELSHHRNSCQETLQINAIHVEKISPPPLNKHRDSDQEEPQTNVMTVTPNLLPPVDSTSNNSMWLICLKEN